MSAYDRSEVPVASIPQALATGFSSRLELEQTSLFISTQPVVRATKRALANAISYAEIEEDYDEDDDDSTYTGGMETPITGEADYQSQQHVPQEQAELKKMEGKTRHVLYTRQQLQDVADKEEFLIPVKISIDVENNYRVIDFFMWNVNEEVVSPEDFAMITCNDLGVAVGYSTTIANTIRNYVHEYRSLANVKLPTDSGIHVIMNLSVALDKQLYEDKFEWDLSSNELTPEAFAKSVVQDLGLSGEFYPAIAHSLHETILRMKREMSEGHLFPTEVDNMAAYGAEAGWRIDQETLGDEWAPTVERLSPEEIEKREIERERNIRRLKRESARMTEVVDYRMYDRTKRRRGRYDDSPSASPAYW